MSGASYTSRPPFRREPEGQGASRSLQRCFNGESYFRVQCPLRHIRAASPRCQKPRSPVFNLGPLPTSQDARIRAGWPRGEESSGRAAIPGDDGCLARLLSPVCLLSRCLSAFTVLSLAAAVDRGLSPAPRPAGACVSRNHRTLTALHAPGVRASFSLPDQPQRIDSLGPMTGCAAPQPATVRSVKVEEIANVRMNSKPEITGPLLPSSMPT